MSNGDEFNSENLVGFFEFVFSHLDEKQRRLVAGGMARLLGRSGVTAVAEATGMSRNTVTDGAKAFDAREKPSDRVRREGGGGPRREDVDDDLLMDLDHLVEPDPRGDPMSPLRWTVKSTRQLAKALREMGHEVSSWKVAELLRLMEYSMQTTAKVVDGAQHPDRNDQFEYINSLAGERLAAGLPVISVDCKKRELVNERKANDGHEFPHEDVPKAIPHGVFDLGSTNGWMSVGDDQDTSGFAVNAIRRWWESMGRARYPDASTLMVTADAGCSNGYRNRFWKVELAKLAAETGFEITVCHCPPGTAKWNRIEHRMFKYITKNWRGETLTSYQVIVDLVASATTETGLRILAEWDQGYCLTGPEISDEQFAGLPLVGRDWHPEWNYDLIPTRK